MSTPAERIRAAITNTNVTSTTSGTYDALLALDELVARCSRLEAALRRVMHYEFDVNATAEQDVGAMKEIAREALTDE